MDILSVAARLGSGTPVTIDPARCVNARSNRDCHACLDACPSGALVSSGLGAPVVSPDACTSCGVCVPTCPTRALSINNPEPLLSRLAAAATVAISCAGPSNQGGLVRCLAGIDAETLAATAAGRTVDLVAPGDAECDACPVGGRLALEPLVETAQALLQRFGLPGSIRLRFDGGEGGRAEPNARTLDRRGLFSLFRARAAAVALPVPASSAEDAAAPSQAARGRFLRVARAAASVPGGQAGAAPGHFAALVRGSGPEQCDGCEACTHVCPAGALMFELAEEGEVLAFRPDRCFACGICVEACPRGALATAEWFSPSAVTSGEAEPLFVLEQATCERCGVHFHGAGAICAECDKVAWMTEAVLGMRADKTR